MSRIVIVTIVISEAGVLLSLISSIVLVASEVSVVELLAELIHRREVDVLLLLLKVAELLHVRCDAQQAWSHVAREEVGWWLVE